MLSTESSVFLFWQMDVCPILAFLEQNATVTLTALGPAVHVLPVSLEMELSVRTSMRYTMVPFVWKFSFDPTHGKVVSVFAGRFPGR